MCQPWSDHASHRRLRPQNIPWQWCLLEVSHRQDCRPVLRLQQLWSIHRSVSRSILQSLVSSLVLYRLDYGNASLAGIPSHLLTWLQSVMNAAARIISSSRFDHSPPLLCQFHWLKASEQIAFKCDILEYKCLHRSAYELHMSIGERYYYYYKCRGSSATLLCLVCITDRWPHSTIHLRGPSLYGGCCSYLEQFTSARHFYTFDVCLAVTTQDSSFGIPVNGGRKFNYHAEGYYPVCMASWVV